MQQNSKAVCQCGHGEWRHAEGGACTATVKRKPCPCARFTERKQTEASPEGDNTGKPGDSPQSSRAGACAREESVEPRSENHTGPDENGAADVEPRSENYMGSDEGRKHTPEYDARKRLLEHECYQRYVVKRQSKSQIAREMNLDRGTVAEYIAAEAERRRPEFERMRSIEIQKSIEIYESVANKYLDRMEDPTAKGDEGRYVIQARERIDALLGLDEPMKLKDETPGAAESRGILRNLDADQRTALLLLAIEKRKQAS